MEKHYANRNNIYIVKGNEKENSFRDMQLMSMCKHNIVANSSFSFWGAYLNTNPHKIVVASKIAYDGCKVPFYSSEWILM